MTKRRKTKRKGITPAARKAKGRRFQQWLQKQLLDAFPELEEDDIQWRSMGAAGEDLILSPKARQFIPFSFECANQEKVSIWAKWAQAEANSGRHMPAVCIKRNREAPKVLLDAMDFIELLIAANFNREELSKILGKRKETNV